MKAANGMDRYSYRELFDLWRRFRKDPAVVKLLQDFAMTTKETAQQLNTEFKTRYEAEFTNTND